MTYQPDVDVDPAEKPPETPPEVPPEAGEDEVAVVEPQRPLDDRYFVGFWNDLPNFGCPHCYHKTVNGPAAIEEHIYDNHPDLGDFDDASNGSN